VAEGLQLGRAFFNFALGTEEFAKGAAGLVSTAANTAGKISPQAGKIGDSFAKVDEKLGGVIRSTERFSRGLRSVSPDISHAQEMVYQYEDAQSRLGRTIERQKFLIQEKEAAEKRNLSSIARLAQEEGNHKQKVLELTAAMQNEQAILEKMQQATAQDAAAIEKQTNKYDKAVALHDRLITYKERLQHQVELLTAKQQNETAELGLATNALEKQQQKVATMEAQSGVLTGTITKLTTEYQLFATRLNDSQAAMDQEAAGLRQTKAAIVETQNAIKDLSAEKMRFSTLEKEAPVAIPNSQLPKKRRWQLRLNRTKMPIRHSSP
jgi:chromosome segregation ATPase